MIFKGEEFGNRKEPGLGGGGKTGQQGNNLQYVSNSSIW